LDWDFSKPLHLRTLDVDLQRFGSLMHELYEQRALAATIISHIHCLFDQLPIPTHDKDDFWLNLPPEKRLACMQSICRVSELFIQTVNQMVHSPEKMQENQLCIYKGLAIQHRLMREWARAAGLFQEVAALGMPYKKIVERLLGDRA
jgi:hypothetical protein